VGLEWCPRIPVRERKNSPGKKGSGQRYFEGKFRKKLPKKNLISDYFLAN
jgi:hypothetical protein